MDFCCVQHDISLIKNHNFSLHTITRCWMCLWTNQVLWFYTKWIPDGIDKMLFIICVLRQTFTLNHSDGKYYSDGQSELLILLMTWWLHGAKIADVYSTSCNLLLFVMDFSIRMEEKKAPQWLMAIQIGCEFNQILTCGRPKKKETASGY